jgi:hypothetical protein
MHNHRPVSASVVKRLVRRGARPLVLAAVALLCAACATTEGALEADEPLVVAQGSPSSEIPLPDETEATVEEAALDSEVPLIVAESEPPAALETGPRASAAGVGELAEVTVFRRRHEAIRDLVAEARNLLRNVELEYVFTGKGRKAALRGRPVVFALWSETKQEWTVAHIEIPRPPVKWRPGGRPMPFVMRTRGVQARHVKGSGAERLMFSFTRDGESLRVYGRKFPVFDNTLVKKKKWRAVVDTARPILYLPSTADTLDADFVRSGREFLLATARKALDELRAAREPSRAFPGELLADVVPAEVIATLAVIEQTDDGDFRRDKAAAFNEVLSQYGLKREEAFRYSVSTAAALGAMQFTNRKGNGTYSLVVRRCPGARLDPNFERGATDLPNAMKAAICLFDIELRQMRADIREAYRDNMHVLGIFPVAAYNGGPRNVGRLHGVMKRMGVRLEQLRRPAEQPVERPVACPCLWKAVETGVRPVSIPKYNNENRWYIEKYQSILTAFE